MRTHKLQKLNIITLTMLTLAIICLAAGFTLALTQFTAKQTYELDSATNYFSLENDGAYYKSFTLSDAQSSQTVTVYNNVVNAALTNPEYDLLVFAPSGTTAAIDGQTPVVKASDDGGKCYVFKGLSHSSPSADGSMDVSVTLTGATSGSTLKTVVITSSDKNVYVSDFFELQLANNENYYNTYYEQDYGDWTLAATGTYLQNGTDVTLSNIGTFSFSDTATTADSIDGTLEDGTLTLDFDSVTFSNGLTVSGSNKFVFNLTDGKYVNSAYGIRLELTGGAVTVEYLPYTNFDAYKNLYFTKTVTTDGAFILNIPCKINLLYSRLILNADMQISHHYGGSYSVTAIPSALQPIDNSSHTLAINCPRAYYYTGTDGGTPYGAQAMVTNAENLTKTSDCVDFSAAENSALLSALIDDAEDYFLGYTQAFVWSDFVLPVGYQSYGITYSYSSDNSALDRMGNVTRGSDNVTVRLTTDVYFNGVQKGSAYKDVLVVGTSESAKMQALAAMLQIHINKSTVRADGQNVLDKNVELLSLIKVLMDAESGLSVTERFMLDGGNLPFVIQSLSNNETLSYEADEIEFLPTDGTVTLYRDGQVVVNAQLSNLTSLYLEKPTFVLNGGLNNVTVNYNYVGSAYTQTATASVHLDGMTFAEKTAYIERYIETLYLTGSNVPFDILQVANGGMYRGTVAGGNRVLDSNLGATAMTYTIYQMPDTEHAELHAGRKTIDEITDKEDKTSLFTVTDGQIYVGAISAPPNQALVMIITIAFDSAVAEETEYSTHREIILPAAGIGGTDYTQYTSGNTFGEYFDSLTDGKLIASTADEGNTKGTGYEFKTFESGVSLEMTVVNTAAVVNDTGDVFCELVYNASGRFYQISIDTDKIPARNTTVQLSVRFYIENDQHVQTDISTQSYSFIIPGIYKQGRDVTSAAVYARMLEVYDNYNGTLLVDGAKAQKAVFDCSLATLTGITAADTVSLKGVELLTNTASMIFDGVKIESLAPFSDFETHVLTALSMDGCSITDSLITAQNDGGYAHLYYLNRLSAISLDGNSITALLDENGNPYLYRTVTNLSLAAQRLGEDRCLTSLNGVSKLSGLQTLDVSGNAIAYFGDLTDCDELTSAELNDNIATEFSGKRTSPVDENAYFGSNGKVNVSVYVALMDNGVTVNNGATLFTADERICALSLNAISAFRTQYGGITFPSVAYVGSTGSATQYAITVEYLLKNNSALSFSSASVDTERNKLTATLSDGDTVQVIASVTVNGTTTYRLFSFLYREVTA